MRVPSELFFTGTIFIGLRALIFRQLLLIQFAFPMTTRTCQRIKWVGRVRKDALSVALWV